MIRPLAIIFPAGILLAAIWGLLIGADHLLRHDPVLAVTFPFIITTMFGMSPLIPLYLAKSSLARPIAIGVTTGEILVVLSAPVYQYIAYNGLHWPTPATALIYLNPFNLNRWLLIGAGLNLFGALAAASFIPYSDPWPIERRQEAAAATKNILILTLIPCAILLIAWATSGADALFASLGSSHSARLFGFNAGLTFPYVAAAAAASLLLPTIAGSPAIRIAASATSIGLAALLTVICWRQSTLLPTGWQAWPIDQTLRQLSPGLVTGAMLVLFALVFAIKVAISGNRVFAKAGPRRILGSRAIHGDAQWMSMDQAKRLFPDNAGIVIGERYRVDHDGLSVNFDPRTPPTWGTGGKAPLLCFDAGFGSTHGIAFAGSGGFKTTSIIVPTALKFQGSLVILDPTTEIAAMVARHRQNAGQNVLILDPQRPDIGFNALDWLGQHGSSIEEDIASVAAWIMADKPRLALGSDDFFRTSAEQLVTGIIANVVLSEPNDKFRERSLREVRRQLAQPEKTLQDKLTHLYNNSENRFVREVIAPFTNMTPQTFSGVYATATKDTHWLSYDNYAAMVSGDSFRTQDIANGKTTIILNVDLSTLENHPGLARVVIGAFLKATYNRNGDLTGRTLFLLDEVARLGYMRIIETARDAGRKYGITLLMAFQSLGQLRETFGGRDAASKWFESCSWISFAAINDPETAKYISDRCGMTTVQVRQHSRNAHQTTRSDQLSQRPLIRHDEVLQMRLDEQIVFTAGNPPLRCGRAIYFRRPAMRLITGNSQFTPKNEHPPGTQSSAS